MNTVLIIGVSGFIGRALSKRMLTKGWQIRGTFRSAKHVSGIPAAVEIVQVCVWGTYIKI